MQRQHFVLLNQKNNTSVVTFENSERGLVLHKKGAYWPTCLLCCLVFRRTICRMLELVMSDTTSDTRFHTRNRAPHSMWYWRRRIPCRHSWPSSIFLHFPFLKGRKEQIRYFLYTQKVSRLYPWILNTVHWWRRHMRDFVTKSQVICKSSGMASDLKTTRLIPNKYQPGRLHLTH